MNICNLHGIDKLFKKQPPKRVIHHYSSNGYREKEIQALSYMFRSTICLDQHIP